MGKKISKVKFPRIRKLLRKDEAKNQFESTIEQAVSDFLKQEKIKAVGNKIEFVFNNDDLIRQFSIYLLVQLKSFIYTPETIKINGKHLR